jgi:Subtilase family
MIENSNYSESSIGLNSNKIPAQSLQNLMENANSIDTNQNIELQPENNKNYSSHPKIDGTLINMLKTGHKSSQESIKVIILFNSEIEKSQRVDILKKWKSCEILRNYDIIPGVSLRISRADLAKIVDTIENISEISYISQNHVQKIEQSNFDELNQISEENWQHQISSENWWLKSIGAINLKETGKGVKLAIMDTGVSVHPDFFENGDSSNSRIVRSKNFAIEDGIVDPDYTFDDYGHGTHCAGIAGGNGFLSDGKYRGVAPNVDLINAKIFNSSGYLSEDDEIAAIEWCVKEGVDIISMSFGSLVPEVWNIESLAIQNAVANGTIVVTSAGNSGPGFFSAGSPGSGLYSISVGATDVNNHVIDFSSLGPSYSNQLLPDICAPGVDIISTEAIESVIYKEKHYTEEFIVGNNYFSYIPLSGTSMSSPMVAGAIALLLEAFPQASPEAIRNALYLGATEINRPSSEGYGLAQGAGLINVTKSREYLSNTEKEFGSVNSQVRIYPRQVPYAPFDLLNFPGDNQILNLTLYSANKTGITIEYPSFEGIEITTGINEYTFDTNNLISLPMEILIKFNANIGQRSGNIIVKDKITGDILDSIPFRITVRNPIGKVYFDSYHGLNDYYPSETLSFNQIDLYHVMHDLSNLGYQLIYRMNNWTPHFSAITDANIISYQALSDVDILVLQTPILPYSDYEIKVIQDFYNNGGSVLFLGTKSQNMCLKSINALFTSLGTDISVKNDTILDLYDYGLFAQYSIKYITDINKNSPIFQGVGRYQFNFGNTFKISGNAINLSSYNNQIIGAAVSGSGNRGNFVALGDYHLLSGSNYNDPYMYGNHSKLINNLFNYLNVQDDIEISLNLKDRSINDPNLNMVLNVHYSNNQTPISDLQNDKTLNVSIFTQNITQNVTFTHVNSGLYQGSYLLNSSFHSNISLVLKTDINLNDKHYYENFSINYYPSIIDGYVDIYPIEFANSYQFIINASNEDYKFDSHFCINPNTYLSKKNMVEFNNESVFSNGNHSVFVSKDIISIAGTLIINSISYLNISKNYLDLSPDRIFYRVIDRAPIINQSRSVFNGIPFSNTRSGDYIVPVEIELDTPYLLFLSAFDYVDPVENLSVVCSLIPVFSYKGYINILFPDNFPVYDFTFNKPSQTFISTIEIPSTLNYTNFNSTKAVSMESDLGTYYSVLWFTVRDMDGGSTDFLILLVGYEAIPNIYNFTPLIILGGLLAVCVIILNNLEKIKKKLRRTKNNGLRYD